MLAHIRGIYGCCRVAAHVVYEYTRHVCGYMTYAEYISRIMTMLVSHCILFTKVIQCAASSHTVLAGTSETTVAQLRQFTNDVPYTDDDVDYAQLLHIITAYNIRLSSVAPSNSGMMSLIYRGHVQDTGHEVVIKVLRKHIVRKINDGVLLLQYLYRLMYVLLYPFQAHRALVLLRSLIESPEYLIQQCEFGHEIARLREAGRLFKPLPYVVVPAVHNIPTDTDFIVMDYIAGCNIADVADPVIYATQIMSYIVWSIMHGTHLHLDIHAGNVICIPGMDTDTHRIGVIDYGIMSPLDSALKNTLLCAIKLHPVRLPNTKPRKTTHIRRITNGILCPEISYDTMSAACATAVDNLLIAYIDGVFAGRYDDDILTEMLASIRRISGHMYSFNLPMCRVFMGITICNNVILRCIDFDKTRYIAMLSEVFTALSGIPVPG